MPDNDHLKFPTGRAVAQVREEAKRLVRDNLYKLSYYDALSQLARENGVNAPWTAAVSLLKASDLATKKEGTAIQNNASGEWRITVEDLLGFWLRKQPMKLNPYSRNWPCLEMPLPRTLVESEGLIGGEKTPEQLAQEIRQKLHDRTGEHQCTKLDLVRVWRSSEQDNGRYLVRLPAVLPAE